MQSNGKEHCLIFVYVPVKVRFVVLSPWRIIPHLHISNMGILWTDGDVK